VKTPQSSKTSKLVLLGSLRSEFAQGKRTAKIPCLSLLKLEQRAPLDHPLPRLTALVDTVVTGLSPLFTEFPAIA
jgi:hypothetical protein